MIELQHADHVHATRRAFRDGVQGTCIDTIQRLTGRTVRAFVADYRVGTDLAVELLLLEPAPDN